MARPLARKVIRFLLGAGFVACTAFIIYRWLIPVFELRIHAVVVGVAALYLGLGDVLAWNTISNLDKILSDVGRVPIKHLVDLTKRIRDDRRMMLQRLKIIVLLKGAVLAAAPAVFDANVTVDVKRVLLVVGYVIVAISVPLMLRMFRDYESAANFRDTLIVDERARSQTPERAGKGDPPHDFRNDPEVEKYYTVVEPEIAAR